MSITTVNDITPRIQYTATSSQTVFAYPFPIFEDADLVVVQKVLSTGITTTLTLTTDYTVSGATNPAGGNVTLVTGATTGDVITIYRDIAIERLTDYQTNGDFLAADVNDDFDRQVLVDQQLEQTIARAIQFSQEDEIASTEIGTVATRASKSLGFTSTGEIDYIAGTMPVGTLRNYTTTAAAVSDIANIVIGDTLLIDEYATGNAGKGIWHCVDATTVTENEKEIITGNASKSLSLDITSGSININQFGATGDGSTDDTVAIQAALDSGIKIITGESGSTYKVTGALSVPANVWLEMTGVTFTASTHFKMFDFVDGGGINGATLTGAGDSSLTVGSIGIGCNGTNNAPSAPTFVTGCKVTNCTISAFGEYGILLEYVNDARITGNLIHDVGYACVGGVSCNDTKVINNTLRDIDQGSAGGDAYGVFIDRQDGTSETEEPRSYRCVVSGNIVQNIKATSGNNGQGIDTHAGVDFTISNNIIEDCEVGIAVTASAISGVIQLAPQRVTVSGNTIKGTASIGYGILVSGAIVGSTVNEYADNIVLSCNVLEQHGIDADTLSGAIWCQATRGLVIDGGSIKEPSPYGIGLNQENKGFNISGVSILNPNDTTVTATQCIAIRGNKNTGYIGDCTFIYDSTLSSGSNIASESIRTHTGITGTDIDLGRCSFIGLDATHLIFQNLIASGIRFDGFHAENGTGTISVTNTGANGITDITFGKRFPYIPDISVNLTYPYNQGGKAAVIGVDTAVAPTATGFRIYATPYDLSTWTATGTLAFTYSAA